MDAITAHTMALDYNSRGRKERRMERIDDLRGFLIVTRAL